MLDESNDRGDNKQLVILARVYDVKLSSVKTKFIDMPICNSGTGQNLFDTVDQVFRLVYYTEGYQINFMSAERKMAIKRPT